jgi:4-amino-4-deoxy-L-arabinose transferase-like glycosyltransferase
MINLARSREFIKEHYADILFIGFLLFVVIFSALTLATRPRLWVDEALTIDLAHNFLKSGVLDVQISPGQFSGLAYLLQSTGYPLTVFLALAYKFFGYSLVTSRAVMLLLMLACLAAVFLFGKKIFDKEKAILAILLIISFASFYGSGRTAVGEIPGFIFLVAGLYLWLFRRTYFWSGLFLGLAIVTKPSVFLLIIPAIVITLFFEREDFFKKNLKIGLGMMPAAIGWIFLVLSDPFSKTVWLGIGNFYKNPYGGEIASNVIGNLSGFFGSTTLLYFSGLFLLIIWGRYWLADLKLKSFYNFVIFYALIAFAYYLRSPGWLRYILIAELLMLFTIPSALSIIFSKSDRIVSRIKASTNKLVVAAVLFLAAIQFGHLFTAAQIYASDSAIKTAAFINGTFSGKSIGVINALDLSILLDNNRKYQSVDLRPIAFIGNDFLQREQVIEIVVSLSGGKLTQNEEAALESRYKKFISLNGYEIYIIKKELPI